jgi:betaine lipid synthase
MDGVLSLLQANADRLHQGLVNNLTVASGFFLEELRARKYSKVILMDHVDWLDMGVAKELADSLAQQVRGGVYFCK